VFFFDIVMAIANKRGIVVFVSTSNLMVAKFLHGLNDGTKARAFKKVSDEENFSCQAFGWTEEKRLEFLRIRAKQKGLEIENDILRAQAEEAFEEGYTVREMDDGLSTAIRYTRVGTSEENQDNQPVWCSGCLIS
jgi:hypothetical protein